jgi:predicted phosphodiesterase
MKRIAVRDRAIVGLATAVAVSVLLCAGTSQGADPGACPMRFAVLGDRTGSHTPGIHGAIIAEIERLKPDFVMGVGDMIEGYSGDMQAVASEWEEYKHLIEPLTMPVHLVAGNHDIWDDQSLELFKRYVGDPYYSFDVGDVHFLVLDTSRWDSSAALPEDQIDWVKSDLEDHRDAAYTLAFLHKPYWIETTAVGRPDRLHSLFVDYGVDAVFTGHYHIYFSGEFDGISYTGIGSSGGYCEPGVTGIDYHYAWVTVDESGITVAPIKMGSVMPWDAFTADGYHFVSKVEREAVDVEKLSVGRETAFPRSPVMVSVTNLDSTTTLSGAITWEVPHGWTVRPDEMPIEIAPLGSHNAEFSVGTEGPLYPVPVLYVDYPFGEDGSFKVRKPLPLSRSAVAHKVTIPVVLDGEVTDMIWDDPTSTLFAPDGSPIAADHVDFYFAWDDDNLYLAARCAESDTGAIAAAQTEHDAAVYGEDCVGYFFQPVVPVGPVYQIYFNPLGTAFDQKIDVKDGVATRVDREWNGTYETATSRGADYWSIEVRIPVEQLGATVAYGDTWALNFRRRQKRLNTTADWQVPLGYDPKDYGVLLMQ